ncbi:hypothetical protein ES705_15120 [subsurface metagenome]
MNRNFSSSNEVQKIAEINHLLFYNVWENDTIDNNQKDLIIFLLNNLKSFYGRKKNKEIINIGLSDPSCHNIGDQSLMFGPAGNFLDKPAIIITGISTSITAANSIALELESLNINNINANDLREIYLHNIYKGPMYTKFKKYWIEKSKGSIFENDFNYLSDMIEGKKGININSNIIVTQLTLHGIATYFDDKRHKRKAWSSPAPKIFNNTISEYLYNDYFVNSILSERFIPNDNAKFLFVMGDDAFKKIKQTFRNNEIDSLKHCHSFILVEKINSSFTLKDYEKENNKFIIKVPHPAA